MLSEPDYLTRLEAKVREQLRSRRVGFLLGAGSSYLDGQGYPLSLELWDLARSGIADERLRSDIQAKLDEGAVGIEAALDALDDGGAIDMPHRHAVTEAIATHFASRNPNLDQHAEFVSRVATRVDPSVSIFSLNYDPLIERAAESANVRLADGFHGVEHAFFDPAVFEERIGRIRGSYRGRQFEETVRPLHLLKLHGSLGWYECPVAGVRRCAFDQLLPEGTKRLMVPPQRRKANDTMLPPYAVLWSTFRGSLAHNVNPINRLACVGYGFADEHVNGAIEAALARTDFTLLILARELQEDAWVRWSTKRNVILVTEARCALKGEPGPGHPDLWRFERLSKEV